MLKYITKLKRNNLEFKKILSNFIIFSALALNIEFVLGDFGDLEYHNLNILFIAIVFNIISTITKMGENNAMGDLIVSSSILALLQLIIAAGVWFYIDYYGGGINSENLGKIVSLAIGALIFNSLSVLMLIIDAAKLKR
jgi:hypothetical protein